jgi:YHS domain-containing protein
MRFLIQILVFLMLIYFVRTILRALLPSVFSQPTFKNTQNPSQSRSRVVKQGKMEKDPTCGTYVDISTSLHETFGGNVKYFCSPDCLNKYQQTFYHERNSKSV